MLDDAQPASVISRGAMARPAALCRHAGRRRTEGPIELLSQTPLGYSKSVGNTTRCFARETALVGALIGHGYIKVQIQGMNGHVEVDGVGHFDAHRTCPLRSHPVHDDAFLGHGKV
jgi:hypothetical protein